MLTVTHATYLDGFRIHITLSHGTLGIADFRGRLDGPIFEPLNSPQFLASFELTEHTLQWENGADFAPEYLRELIKQTESANDAMQQHVGNDLIENGDTPPVGRCPVTLYDLRHDSETLLNPNRNFRHAACRCRDCVRADSRLK